jgi:hypothetical protein
MNPNPQDIRKQFDLDDLEDAGNFCSTFQVSPVSLKQLKNILFKKPDPRTLLGPIFGSESSSKSDDEK